MPKNPSSKQRKASANNLKGKWGPKTPEGKRISSRNGKKNKGPKTTKEKAKIIYARWGSLKGTLYDRSECLQCQMNCKGKSFSRKVQLKEYSLQCFDKIIHEYPSECFYYFRGLCGIRYTNPILPTDYCILDDQNLRRFSSDNNSDTNNIKELRYRERFIKVKCKIEKCLASYGNEFDTIAQTVIWDNQKLSDILKTFKVCGIENKAIDDYDEKIKNLFFFR